MTTTELIHAWTDGDSREHPSGSIELELAQLLGEPIEAACPMTMLSRNPCCY